LKIKLDENIPGACAELFGADFDVHTVAMEGLEGRNDDAIWAAVNREERLLITQELDFSDVRKFHPGTHPGILPLRLANPSRSEIELAIRRIIADGQILTWQRCFVVATHSKLRVIRPD
jgi:predicted nuclease of predicted toxin-antitoxin system